MGTDGTDREQALEARIARLEERLAHLENEGRPSSSEPAIAGNTAAAAAPPTPPPVAPPTVSGWVLPKSARPQASVVAAPATAATSPWPSAPMPATSTWPAAQPQSQSGGIDVPSFADLEARLTGRALAWVGGLALVLGAVFFLSLAFSRGWIGPEIRVLMGLIAGSTALAGGAVLMERESRLLGHVLTAVGLAIISISLVAATRLYGLIPIELGLAIAFLSAVVAATVAIRADSPVVASLGLIAVLAAPPLLDAPADLQTLAFVGVVLVGTTAVALWRAWRWLPPVAFVLAAPQAAALVSGDTEPGVAMVGLGLFALLNLVAAGGEEFRRHRDDLSASSAALLLANAAFLVWAGFTVLDQDLEPYRGSFLVIASFAHLAIGVWFVMRDGERNLFGLLTIGAGIALLTMAAPAQLGAPAVPVAWTAEAVALAWLAVRRGHPYSAFASAVLYGLAGIALVDLFLPAQVAPDRIPFTDTPGAALGYFLVGIAAGVWIVRDRSLRSGLAAFGVLIATVCAAARLDDPSLVIALSVLMVIGVGVHRLIPRLPSNPIPWQVDGLIAPDLRTEEWRPAANECLVVASMVVGAIASGVLLQIYGLPFRSPPSGRPFLDPTGAAALALTMAIDLAGLLHGAARARRIASITAAGVLAYAIASEFDPWLVVILWVAIGAALTAMTRLDRAGRLAYLGADIAFIGGAAIVAVAIVAPPTRLVVGLEVVDAMIAIESAAALAAVCAGLGYLGWSARDRRWARWSWLAAGVTLVYLLSIAVVDAVATQIGGSVPTRELRTWGQVALSVLWATLGVIAFVAGLRLRLSLLRQAGLVLLAIATAKVFLIDLSALDVAYRVVSLIALGLLLLVSAGLWQRLQPKPTTPVDQGIGARPGP